MLCRLQFGLSDTSPGAKGVEMADMAEADVVAPSNLSYVVPSVMFAAILALA